MESQNITIDPQTDFKEGKAEPLSVPLENTLQRSSRIKKIQTTAMILLFLAAVINYLDRSSLSVANLTIRQELGLNATEIGALLSVFSLAYGIAQLPCGPLLDRKGPRIMLGLGMFFWSLFQALSGMVHSFTQFVLVRIGMGIGEAPMNPCGVKVINDWFNIKERGRPMGFFNAASTIGVAVSPPIPCRNDADDGLALDVYHYRHTRDLYRYRLVYALSQPGGSPLTADEQAYLNAGSVNVRRDPLSFAEWRSLFKNKTMWGMMLGFSGINYTAWLYLAWLPGYLQTAYNLDLKSTGFMAAIPFLFGAAGMLINGYVTDWLVKGGMAPIKSRKDLHHCRDVLLRGVYTDRTACHYLFRGGVVNRYGVVLHSFCRNVLLGIDPRSRGIKNDGFRRQYSEFRQLYLRFICTGGDRIYCRYHPFLPAGAGYMRLCDRSRRAGLHFPGSAAN